MNSGRSSSVERLAVRPKSKPPAEAALDQVSRWRMRLIADRGDCGMQVSLTPATIFVEPRRRHLSIDAFEPAQAPVASGGFTAPTFCRRPERPRSMRSLETATFRPTSMNGCYTVGRRRGDRASLIVTELNCSSASPASIAISPESSDGGRRRRSAAAFVRRRRV